jgi:L-alanine-DL-glutamate epimerase-like enolase superfamily enzyme
MVSRRNFIKTAGTVPLVLGTSPLAFAEADHESKPDSGPIIKKIVIFTSTGNFYRYIGLNAYGKDKKGFGINRHKRAFKIELSDGTIGLGVFGHVGFKDSTGIKLKQLIGRDILSCYNWKDDRIIGVSSDMTEFFFDTQYSWIESGILDAVGKMKQLPVWKLFGESVRDGIDPYDGTLYFEDIVNDTDARIIGQIGKRIKEDGYRAIKIKLGRPFRWLTGEAGLQRDIDAFIALREAVGYNINIMADANNGYQDQFDLAVRLMKACAPYSMYFMEELFPDNAAQYKDLRNILLEENFYIPIAEGESFREMDELESACRDGVYSYVQPDMPTWGFSNIISAAKIVNKYQHVKLIPHVWQNQIGLIMSLHASKIQSDIIYVEDSRFSQDAFDCTEYIFRNGQWFIPDKPGWGISLAPFYEQFFTKEPLQIS